jgi:DNA-binding CsgD family transcriptional regulator/tetratricopeptide (TPR) repeat protein
MGTSVSGRTSEIVGRASELDLLRRAWESAAEGTPAAVLVRGEAGVGKTTLVAGACDQARRAGFEILWGRCVRFTAASSAYLPLGIALQGWAAEADPAFRDAVLADTPGLRRLVPSLAEHPAMQEPGRLLTEIDTVVSRIAVNRPVALVIDDLQWSDESSLDALMYLVAGFHGQRLLLLSTIRDEGLGTGHSLHGWLADVRRLPGVQDLRLDRLTEEETEQQVMMLTGSSEGSDAPAQVFARSAGNPYLTELLVRGSGGHGPTEDGVPDQLRTALLATWHRLTPVGRETTRLLALAGRPLAWDEMRALAARAGLRVELLPGALAEATEAGVVIVPRPDVHWFRHPLLADVLYETFLPGQAAPLHAAFAEVLEARSGVDNRNQLRVASDLAEHHLRAGHVDRAFALAVRAADAARDLGVGPEEAHHLTNAVTLWTRAGSEARARVGSEIDLLERAANAVMRVGDARPAYDMLQRALDIVDRRTDALRASRLIMLSGEAALSAAALPRWPTDVYEEAVQLTMSAPDSAEHVSALAHLSMALVWNGDNDNAARNAELAVGAAERCGVDRATALALAARAFCRLGRDAATEGRREAERAHALASTVPGWDMTRHHVDVSYLNLLIGTGDVRAAAELAGASWAAAAQGGARSHAAMFAGLAAGSLVIVGDLAQAARFVREGLAAAPRDLALAMLRLAATELATRTGRLDDALQHLRRVHEVYPDPEMFVGLEAAPVLAEYLLAKDEPDAAMARILRGLQVTTPVDPRHADEVLLWGARVAGVLQQRARDRRDAVAMAEAGSAVDELVRLRSSLTDVPAFLSSGPADMVAPANEALFEAERARAGGGVEPEQWADAAAACGRAAMRWEQARSLWRYAEALIDTGVTRTEIAAPLRQAHRMAVDMGAEALRRELEALARSARVPLTEVEVPEQARSYGGPRSGRLTAREREVLTHLVAGRTYREIAQALFISEKTVSVHVSNLLRKTGTASRGEVAALARRQNLVPGTGADDTG